MKTNMMREQITHVVSAFLAVAAFYWRLESPQKRWTPERALFLLAAAISALWNVYAVVASASGA